MGTTRISAASSSRCTIPIAWSTTCWSSLTASKMRTAIAVGLTRIPMTITLLPRPDPDELEQDPEDDVPIDWLLAAELTNRGYTSRWSTTRRIQWRLNESSLPITKEYTCNGLLAPDSIYTATSRSIRRSALASAILASRSLAPKYASWKAHNEEELDEWKVSLHQQGFDMANGVSDGVFYYTSPDARL